MDIHCALPGISCKIYITSINKYIAFKNFNCFCYVSLLLICDIFKLSPQTFSQIKESLLPVISRWIIRFEIFYIIVPLNWVSHRFLLSYLRIFNIFYSLWILTIAKCQCYGHCKLLWLLWSFYTFQTRILEISNFLANCCIKVKGLFFKLLLIGLAYACKSRNPFITWISMLSNSPSTESWRRLNFHNGTINICKYLISLWLLELSVEMFHGISIYQGYNVLIFHVLWL